LNLETAVTGSPFFDPAELLAGSPPPRKATIMDGDQLFLGMNVYGPGDGQAPHIHADQDKVYIVTEGEGDFQVGEETRRCGVGAVISAGAGVVHGVTNPGPGRLVLLVAMAPPPSRGRS